MPKIRYLITALLKKKGVVRACTRMEDNISNTTKILGVNVGFTTI